MKPLILATIALCLCCATSSFAQNTYSVKGTTTDTATKAKLTATISILNAKDSILQKYTHTAEDGSFVVTGLPAGKFLLLVGGDGYLDYTAPFTLDAAAKEHDFGDIKMQIVPKELKEVTIKADVTAIKIKGDTIEYNAKAYVIQPNDRVEDLLRQLPGIKIDKDGHITAQGEKVQKVLVDGEEFFGDDPTLVTRNLRADMVDKLQLYDAKSEQAKFTGIDDGVKIKTINVQLKVDKKTGVFGKADAGAGIGDNDYYEGQLIYNKFALKQKFALYGTASNDGKLGLGSADNTTIGAGDTQISDNGTLAISIGSYDQLDAANINSGIPESKTGGVHWDDKWDKDKQSINTNYKIGSLGLTTDQTQLQQITVAPGVIENAANSSHNYTNTFRQKIDALYTDILSPTANLRLRLNATDKQVDMLSNNNSTIADGNGALLSKAITSQNSKDHTKIVNADIFYTKRFTKPGRTLSWDINEVYSDENATNYFNSDNYTAKDKADALIDQYKPKAVNSLIVNNNVTYSEPITPTLALTVNYGFALSNTLQDLPSYNASSPNVYNTLDSLHSSKYKLDQMTNQLGAMFNYRWNDTKEVLTFGTKVNDVAFKQINEYTNTTFTRDYFNWMPQVTFRDRITQQGQAFNIGYRGNSIQPGIGQLQPVVTNTNPQFITVGNPNLEPSFQHIFNASYNNNSGLTGQFFSISGNLSFRENPIVPKATIDTATGITTTTSINLNHNTPFNYSIYTNFGRKLNSSGLEAGLSLSTNGGVNYSYNNGVLIKSNNTSYNIDADITAYKAKAYSIYLSGGPNFSILQYSPRTATATNNNSIGFNADLVTQFFLPGKFHISSRFGDNYTGKTQSLPSVNRATLNASLDKAFFKDDNLKLMLSCNNILNQDENFRYSSATTITQTSYNIIKRFLLFTVTWDFTKFGTVPAKK